MLTDEQIRSVAGAETWFLRRFLMISVTKLLGGSSWFGGQLRDYTQSSQESPGSGPVVVWNATKTCNLECLHCYADAETKHFPNELSTSEARAMIDDLAAMNVPALLIAGGEPFVRPDILTLAEYAMSLGIRVTFSTNGTLITKDMAARIAIIGVTYVGISIDGDEAHHDLMRGRPGAFREALRGIRHCRDAGIRVGVRFMVTQDNIGQLDSVFRLVEDEGIGRLSLHHLVYSECHSDLAGIDLEPEQKRALMEKLLAQVDTWNVQGLDIEVMTVDNQADAPFIYYWLLDRDPGRADQALSLMLGNGGNRSGITVAAIDSYGVVHPDQFTSTHAIGSVREQSFSTIWRDTRNELLSRLRDRKPLLKGRCATCQWLSVCNGNFRARAEAATGDFWQSDPGCYLLDSEVISGAPE
jgi:radical SAM protein with 4Fe4S-binding SPASM domain